MCDYAMSTKHVNSLAKRFNDLIGVINGYPVVSLPAIGEDDYFNWAVLSKAYPKHKEGIIMGVFTSLDDIEYVLKGTIHPKIQITG